MESPAVAVQTATNKDGNGQDVTHIFTELRSHDDLLLPVRGSRRLKYTCIACSRQYLALGSSHGGLYVFQRDTLKYLQQIGNKEGLTKAIFSPDENVIGLVTNSGAILVWELNVSSRQRAERVVSTSVHRNRHVTSLCWDDAGLRLFSADDRGRISVTNTDSTKASGIFKLQSELVVDVDSAVVQLDFAEEKLLVSTLTKCYLCDPKKRLVFPIGTKPRDGSYGACFMKKPGSERPSIFCARPGSRLWEANFLCQVLSTHQFKQLLATPPLPVMGRGRTPRLPAADSRHPAQSLSFPIIHPLGNHFLVSWTERGVFVFDPVHVKVVFWTDDITGLVNVTVSKSSLYCLHQDNRIRKYTLQNLDRCAAALYQQSLSMQCARLVLHFPKQFQRSRARHHMPAQRLHELAKHVAGEDSILGCDMEEFAVAVENAAADVASALSSRRSSFDSYDGMRMQSGIYRVARRRLDSDLDSLEDLPLGYDAHMDQWQASLDQENQKHGQGTIHEDSQLLGKDAQQDNQDGVGNDLSPTLDVKEGLRLKKEGQVQGSNDRDNSVIDDSKDVQTCSPPLESKVEGIPGSAHLQRGAGNLEDGRSMEGGEVEGVGLREEGEETLPENRLNKSDETRDGVEVAFGKQHLLENCMDNQDEGGTQIQATNDVSADSASRNTFTRSGGSYMKNAGDLRGGVHAPSPGHVVLQELIGPQAGSTTEEADPDVKSKGQFDSLIGLVDENIATQRLQQVENGHTGHVDTSGPGESVGNVVADVNTAQNSTAEDGSFTTMQGRNIDYGDTSDTPTEDTTTDANNLTLAGDSEFCLTQDDSLTVNSFLKDSGSMPHPLLDLDGEPEIGEATTEPEQTGTDVYVRSTDPDHILMDQEQKGDVCNHSPHGTCQVGKELWEKDPNGNENVILINDNVLSYSTSNGEVEPVVVTGVIDQTEESEIDQRCEQPKSELDSSIIGGSNIISTEDDVKVEADSDVLSAEQKYNHPQKGDGVSKQVLLTHVEDHRPLDAVTITDDLEVEVVGSQSKHENDMETTQPLDMYENRISVNTDEAEIVESSSTDESGSSAKMDISGFGIDASGFGISPSERAFEYPNVVKQGHADESTTKGSGRLDEFGKDVDVENIRGNDWSLKLPPVADDKEILTGGHGFEDSVPIDQAQSVLMDKRPLQLSAFAYDREETEEAEENLLGNSSNDKAQGVKVDDRLLELHTVGDDHKTLEGALVTAQALDRSPGDTKDGETREDGGIRLKETDDGEIILEVPWEEVLRNGDVSLQQSEGSLDSSDCSSFIQDKPCSPDQREDEAEARTDPSRTDPSSTHGEDIQVVIEDDLEVASGSAEADFPDAEKEMLRTVTESQYLQPEGSSKVSSYDDLFGNPDEMTRTTSLKRKKPKSRVVDITATVSRNSALPTESSSPLYRPTSLPDLSPSRPSLYAQKGVVPSPTRQSHSLTSSPAHSASPAPSVPPSPLLLSPQKELTRPSSFPPPAPPSPNLVVAATSGLPHMSGLMESQQIILNSTSQLNLKAVKDSLTSKLSKTKSFLQSMGDSNPLSPKEGEQALPFLPHPSPPLSASSPTHKQGLPLSVSQKRGSPLQSSLQSSSQLPSREPRPPSVSHDQKGFPLSSNRGNSPGSNEGFPQVENNEQLKAERDLHGKLNEELVKATEGAISALADPLVSYQTSALHAALHTWVPALEQTHTAFIAEGISPDKHYLHLSPPVKGDIGHLATLCISLNIYQAEDEGEDVMEEEEEVDERRAAFLRRHFAILDSRRILEMIRMSRGLYPQTLSSLLECEWDMASQTNIGDALSRGDGQGAFDLLIRANLTTSNLPLLLSFLTRLCSLNAELGLDVLVTDYPTLSPWHAWSVLQTLPITEASWLSLGYVQAFMTRPLSQRTKFLQQVISAEGLVLRLVESASTSDPPSSPQLFCSCGTLPRPGSHLISWSHDTVLDLLLRSHDIPAKLLLPPLKRAGYWKGVVQLLRRGGEGKMDTFKLVMQLGDVSLLYSEERDLLPATEDEWRTAFTWMRQCQPSSEAERRCVECGAALLPYQARKTSAQDVQLEDAVDSLSPSSQPECDWLVTPQAERIDQSENLLDETSKISTDGSLVEMNGERCEDSIINQSGNGFHHTECREKEISQSVGSLHSRDNQRLDGQEASSPQIKHSDWCPTITWQSLALLLVHRLGALKAVELLQEMTIPAGLVTREFHQMCILAAISEKQQSILSHAMLEGTGAYLWSKRRNLLGPRLQHTMESEYEEITGGGLNGRSKAERVLEAQDCLAKMQLYIEDPSTHWGRTISLVRSCPVCHGSLTRSPSMDSSGCLVFPCGHVYHTKCIPEKACVSCFYTSQKSSH